MRFVHLHAAQLPCPCSVIGPDIRTEESASLLLPALPYPLLAPTPPSPRYSSSYTPFPRASPSSKCLTSASFFFSEPSRFADYPGRLLAGTTPPSSSSPYLALWRFREIPILVTTRSQARPPRRRPSSRLPTSEPAPQPSPSGSPKAHPCPSTHHCDVTNSASPTGLDPPRPGFVLRDGIENFRTTPRCNRPVVLTHCHFSPSWLEASSACARLGLKAFGRSRRETTCQFLLVSALPYLPAQRRDGQHLRRGLRSTEYEVPPHVCRSA